MKADSDAKRMILAPWSRLMCVPTDCYCPRGFSPTQV